MLVYGAWKDNKFWGSDAGSNTYFVTVTEDTSDDSGLQVQVIELVDNSVVVGFDLTVDFSKAFSRHDG